MLQRPAPHSTTLGTRPGPQRKSRQRSQAEVRTAKGEARAGVETKPETHGVERRQGVRRRAERPERKPPKSWRNAFLKSGGSAEVEPTGNRRGGTVVGSADNNRAATPRPQPRRTGGGAPGTTRRILTTEPAAERPSLLFVGRVGNRTTATVDPRRVDPTIRTCAVGYGTPAGTRSRDAGSVPGRPEAVLDELANALLRKRQPKSQASRMNHEREIPNSAASRSMPLSCRRESRIRDRPIKRLQVATGNRHGSLRLVWRKVGVPIRRDVGGIHTAGEDRSQGLRHSVIKSSGPMGRVRAWAWSTSRRASASGCSPAIRTVVTKDGELLDGILDREERRRSWLRRTATRRRTDITQTVLVIAPEILGRSTQAPIDSSTDDG